MDKRQAEKLVYSLYSNSDSLYIVRMTSYRIFMFYYNGCKCFFVVRGPASCRSNNFGYMDDVVFCFLATNRVLAHQHKLY